jgi:hypothetical protein
LIFSSRLFCFGYRSPWTLLGWPPIHIHFGGAAGQRLPAKGWIACGNVAYGILFASGGIAVGAVSIGGIAAGGVAIYGRASNVRPRFSPRGEIFPVGPRCSAAKYMAAQQRRPTRALLGATSL